MMQLAIPFNAVYLLIIVYFPLFSPVWSLWNLDLQHMKNLQLSSKIQIHGCRTRLRKYMSLRVAEDIAYCSKCFLLLALFFKYVLLTMRLNFWPCMSIPQMDKNHSKMCTQLTKVRMESLKVNFVDVESLGRGRIVCCHSPSDCGASECRATVEDLNAVKRWAQQQLR